MDSTIKPLVECLYVDEDGNAHYKFYFTPSEVKQSEKDVQVIRKSGTKCIRRGYLKSNVFETENYGFDMKDVVLTVLVQYSETCVCRYLAKKYYVGKYIMSCPSGRRVGIIVGHEYMSADQLEEERIIKNFSSHKWFESCAVRAVPENVRIYKSKQEFEEEKLQNELDALIMASMNGG